MKSLKIVDVVVDANRTWGDWEGQKVLFYPESETLPLEGVKATKRFIDESISESTPEVPLFISTGSSEVAMFVDGYAAKKGYKARFWYKGKRVSQNGLFARLNKVFRWIDKVCVE